MRGDGPHSGTGSMIVARLYSCIHPTQVSSTMRKPRVQRGSDVQCCAVQYVLSHRSSNAATAGHGLRQGAAQLDSTRQATFRMSHLLHLPHPPLIFPLEIARKATTNRLHGYADAHHCATSLTLTPTCYAFNICACLRLDLRHEFRVGCTACIS